MAEKRVRFAEEVNEEYSISSFKRSRLEEDADSIEEEDNYPETSIKLPKKHTLDSDEEDETDVYEKLDMKKVEGQEEATLEYEGKVKIMPFNMKEDLEEGHFDSNGTFIFDKKQEDIKDAWLDNIEWDNVKNEAGKKWGKLNDEEKEGEDVAAVNEIDLKSIYARLLEILNEKDNTIAGALKRLNNEKGLSAVEERKRRWAAKKSGTIVQDDERSKLVVELTSLTDSLITQGHMEAYQLGPTRIRELMQELSPVPQAKEATVDMFAEE